MGSKTIGKVKSCNTLKSTADSQIRPIPPNSIESKKLKKTRSLATLRNSAHAVVIDSPKMSRKKLQKTPKIEPTTKKALDFQISIPETEFIRRRKPIKFDWDLCSEDWKSREYTRQFYLEKNRARRFALNEPEGGPYRPNTKSSPGYSHSTLPRATPKALVRPNTQRPGSIFQPRHTPKTPNERYYTMIDIKKYVK